MREAGLDPDKPVPIGVGYLFPSVAEIPAALEAGWGVEFELSDSTTARLRGKPLEPAAVPSPSPIPKPKSRPRVPAGQAMFAFED